MRRALVALILVHGAHAGAVTAGMRTLTSGSTEPLTGASERCEFALTMLEEVSTTVLCGYGRNAAEDLNQMLHHVLRKNEFIHVVSISDRPATDISSGRVCALLEIRGNKRYPAGFAKADR